MDIAIEILKNKTFTNITGCAGETEVVFTETNGDMYRLYHRRDCCEEVTIEDIDGDLKDLIDTPLLMVEESTNCGENWHQFESFTWTFYKFASIKGFVTVRWYGSSNGHYSENVHFEKI